MKPREIQSVIPKKIYENPLQNQLRWEITSGSFLLNIQFAVEFKYSVVALLFATPFQAPRSELKCFANEDLTVVCHANVSLPLFSTQEIKQFATWVCPHINGRFCPLLVFSLECEWPNLDRFKLFCCCCCYIKRNLLYHSASAALIQGEKPQVCMKLESHFCPPLPPSNHASYPQATIMLWSELLLSWGYEREALKYILWSPTLHHCIWRTRSRQKQSSPSSFPSLWRKIPPPRFIINDGRH